MNIRHLLQPSSIFLKTSCAIAATIFWYLFSGMHFTTVSLTIPLCFYNVKEHLTINSPETITVVLHAKRADLYRLDTNSIAAHVDGQMLKTGKQNLNLTDSELLLPPSIKLIHYNPIQIPIIVSSHSLETFSS